MSYDIVSLVPTFCESFLGRRPFEEGEVACHQHLPKEKMDYSIESLRHLDHYLEVVHKQKDKIENQDYTNTVFAAGCYLGEVIRRTSHKNYAWVNYRDYFSTRPQLAQIFPEVMGTAAVLVGENDQAMTAPINKVIRFIEEGPENSTHYYATGELKPRRG
jgi:hypothetical protein